MFDPNTLNQLGKIHQQELIELGQKSARPRLAEPRAQRQIVALLQFLRDGLKHQNKPEVSTERRNYNHV
ncbi:MAG: hypothetical protein CL610_28535 [Anaerolineaceae bacterium]|nr:hypothetical protein [Anaerolineaceae bacterium]